MMGTSFKSFKDIIQESGHLFQKLQGEYWAHIDGQRPYETLWEHSRLVADYLIRVVESNGLEGIIDRVIAKLSEELRFQAPQIANRYIKELFVNSIFLHDLGKVNPNFQVKRMKNLRHQPKALRIEHHHSFPGAYIFCVFHFQQIFCDPHLLKQEKNLLVFITTALSNPIIRHHSSFIDFSNSFDTEDMIAECADFLKAYQIEVEDDLKKSIFSFGTNFRELFEKKSNDKCGVCLYTLIKLSFSLLTACDFYATNEYMAGITVSNFGLIDKRLRTKVKNGFSQGKPFNHDLVRNFEHYLLMPFDNLQNVDGSALNILRQKLAAEAISMLRKNIENHWYYIEAPTGGGKTNLSLACIAELLEKDHSLNKVFYVLPFTTLITQTDEAIQSTIGLTSDDLIQLHSRTGLHYKRGGEDGDARYGDERTLYLDHLFVNYPFTVISHVKFFDIAKGNTKEANYIFHRLCNSIVVIDELQSYNPKHWDKIVFFIEHYAQLLNIRFLIMSATLPKIDELSTTTKGKFISLTPNRDQYFKNPNFLKRTTFDFSLIDELKSLRSRKDEYLHTLAGKIKETADEYASLNAGRVRILVEFITKNTASKFYNQIKKEERFRGFQIYIISGDILEPRRQEVINAIKTGKDVKVLLVSTQVVESGVDIDMDVGFKNRAILDSDEQMAGRINRNASKKGCKVFLFECDSIKTIYGRDERYKQQTSNEYIEKHWKEILTKKKFHELYKRVYEKRRRTDWTDNGKFESYFNNFKNFHFTSIHKDFTLIEDNQSESIFIPLDINIPEKFSEDGILGELDVLTEEGKISGEMVFHRLIEIFKRDTRKDFFQKKIDLRKIAKLVSLFTINLYPRALKELGTRFDPDKEMYGLKYLSHHDVYSYEHGFDMGEAEEDIFL